MQGDNASNRTPTSYGFEQSVGYNPTRWDGLIKINTRQILNHRCITGDPGRCIICNKK